MTWSSYEIEVRDVTAAGFTGPAGALLREWGKVVEEVWLEEQYPDTEVVVEVSECDEESAGIRWRRSYRIWGGSWGWGAAPKETPADAIAAVIYSHILEQSTTTDE